MGATLGQVPEPIIDMHMHASSPIDFGGSQSVCTNRDAIQFPPIDPALNASVQRAATCAHPVPYAQNANDNARLTGEIMRRYNIYGVLGVTTGDVTESMRNAQMWRSFASERYWIALDPGDVRGARVGDLEKLVRADSVKVFAEVSPQYDGETANAERLEPYFALAERLDIPVGLHLGEGPPGGATVMPGSKYSPAAGRPLDLEPLLKKHPKLRLYVMHYGSPLVEEMIALLYSHPNVYVDVAQNDWGFPRAHFYRQLQQLVDAGFAKRIMFGSDQMIWPQTIPIAIETIRSAPFLTGEQKRDILYKNAARFLRLTPDQIRSHRSSR
ncbi:MAG: amidohydrolase family protein [Vicinamibacterales bacterium]